MGAKTWEFSSAKSWQEIGKGFRDGMESWKGPVLYRMITRLSFEKGGTEHENAFAELDGESEDKFNVVAVATHGPTGMQSRLWLRLNETDSGTKGKIVFDKGSGSFAKNLADSAFAAIRAVDPSVDFKKR